MGSIILKILNLLYIEKLQYNVENG